MPLQIVRTDILSLKCDAIINPTDELYSGSGGLDAQIHRAAGPELRTECANHQRLWPGMVTITPGFRLQSRYVIHTVAPWSFRGQAEVALRLCYQRSLALARKNALYTIAFPLIGSGTRGFPKELVLRVAVGEISRFLLSYDANIYLVIHDCGEYQPDPALLASLEKYISTIRKLEKKNKRLEAASVFPTATENLTDLKRKAHPIRLIGKPDLKNSQKDDVEDFADVVEGFLKDSRVRTEILDESFSEMVLRLIDEKGFKKDSDCYRKANIDKRLFSKIRKDANYHPKKTTALALAVALELPPDQTKDLLMKAGYSLSRSILLDIIVEYCIYQKNYNIFVINELLFKYDQPLLGG